MDQNIDTGDATGRSLFDMLRAIAQSEIDLLLRSSSLWTLLNGVIFLSEPFG